MVGIESVPEAIEDAEINAALNGITNTVFRAGDMKDLFTEAFLEEHGRPDVIITDPPRAGMHPDVVAQLLKAAPERIVYVSCNPATQARDVQLLSEGLQCIEESARGYVPPHPPYRKYPSAGAKRLILIPSNHPGIRPFLNHLPPSLKNRYSPT